MQSATMIRETMASVHLHCIVYIGRYKMYTTVHNIHCILYGVQYTVYTVQYTFNILHYIMFNIGDIVHSMDRCDIHNVFISLYRTFYTGHIMSII